MCVSSKRTNLSWTYLRHLFAPRLAALYDRTKTNYISNKLSDARHLDVSELDELRAGNVHDAHRFKHIKRNRWIGL